MRSFLIQLRGRASRFFFPPEAALVPLRQRHWQMLIIAAIVTLLAFTLDIMPGERVGLASMPGAPIPGLCLSKSLFNTDCPGCGLTRSFVALAHGHWQESLHYHRLGWLVALLVVLQFPYRAISLCFPNRRLIPRPIPDVIAWGLFAALCTQWFVRQYI